MIPGDTLQTSHVFSVFAYEYIYTGVVTVVLQVKLYILYDLTCTSIQYIYTRLFSTRTSIHCIMYTYRYEYLVSEACMHRVVRDACIAPSD